MFTTYKKLDKYHDTYYQKFNQIFMCIFNWLLTLNFSSLKILLSIKKKVFFLKSIGSLTICSKLV